MPDTIGCASRLKVLPESQVFLTISAVCTICILTNSYNKMYREGERDRTADFCRITELSYSYLQATFLKGKALAAQNPALREELEQLEAEALALRCRRNGLSRSGGKEEQVQRLMNLQAYLSDDVEADAAARPAAPPLEALPAVSCGGHERTWIVRCRLGLMIGQME